MKMITAKTLWIGLLVLLISCGQSSKDITPESVGLSSDTLKVAESKMQEYIDNGEFAGISTLVMKNGHVVQRAMLGFADIETQKPIENNTIFRIFSMTKPITAVALMTLYDEGKFQLDDKVSKFIPEFEGVMVYSGDTETDALEPLSNDLTIRHLLTHSSGISYGWDRNSYVDSLYNAAGAGGWDGTIGEKVKILAGLPLNFQPGSKWLYGLSIDVAGYLVEVLSGVPLDEYFKTKIFDPLKMNDSGFYVQKENHNRLSNVFHFDKEGKLKGAQGGFSEAFKTPVTLFSGGGGLVSTMDDYKRFCMMLLNGGELEGAKILEEKTVQMIMTDQLPKETKYKTEGKGYGLAGEVDLKTGEYSWAGAASTNFWIDPKNEMIVITYAQLMPSNYEYAHTFKKWVNKALVE